MRTIYYTPAGVGCYRTRSTEPGTCLRCGRDLIYRYQQGMYYCPRRVRDPLWRLQRKAAGRTRYMPECLDWLGAKVGVPADDPRLVEIARQLAEAGKLLALVTKNGSLVALAKVDAEVSNQESRPDNV